LVEPDNIFLSFLLARAKLPFLTQKGPLLLRWGLITVTKKVRMSSKIMNKQGVKLAIRCSLICLTLGLMLGLDHRPGLAASPFFQDSQDLAEITTPAAGATVQGTIQIIGSADHPAFQFYVVEVSPEGQEAWQFVTDGTNPVVNGPLATWDTIALPDGAYRIRLRVVRLDGNYSETFAQPVTVNNSQPLPTDTPAVQVTPTPATPTVTPTALPPTPPIIIEQPIVDTPTPRPVATSAPLQDPDEGRSFIPTVTGFSFSPLRDACIYGGMLMLGLFLAFGFMASLRIFTKGFIDRIKRQSGRRR
jgi:hypothetical protein